MCNLASAIAKAKMHQRLMKRNSEYVIGQGNLTSQIHIEYYYFKNEFQTVM